MAFWTAGFEAGDKQYYIDQGWAFFGGSTTITNVAGRVHKSLAGRGGDYGLYVEDAARSPFIDFGGRWLHFWMSEVQNVGSAVIFRSNNGDQFTVRFDDSGIITFRRGGTLGSVVASSGFNPSVPHWIAIEALLQNVSGQVTVYVDGVFNSQYIGDTQNTGTADWDQFTFSGDNNNFTSYDDVIVTTAAEGRIDEHFLLPMIPDGNDVIGSGSGSTGGAGDFSNVDEIPPDGGTSYNEFTAPGTDRYTTANLSFTPASIHCVTIMNQAARDGIIVGAQTVCATNTGGGGPTEALGAVSGLGASGVYVPWQDTFNTDPNTGVAWTDLSDLRCGVKFT